MELLKNNIFRFTAYYRNNKLVVWFCFLSWLFLSLITSQKTQLYILQNDDLSFHYTFAYFRGFLTWTLIACFVPLILKPARLLPLEGKYFRRNIMAHLFFSICMLFPMTLIFTLILHNIYPTGGTFRQDFLAGLMWLSLIVPIAYWFVIGGVYLRKNSILYHKRRRQTVALQSELKEIQLKVLQAQLRPHFLFNALNTVSALTFEDTKTAVNVLEKIRRYLELSMEETNKLVIPLHEELYFTNLYLDIEKERYSDRLWVEEDIDPAVETALVPNMILQPLIENAVRHGIARKIGPGKLLIRGRFENSHLLIEVEDSGKGFEPVGLVKKEGLGIKNTIERLQKLYNEDYSFDIGRSTTGGAKVTVRIPFRGPEGMKQQESFLAAEEPETIT